jgi:hypothetical protein
MNTTQYMILLFWVIISLLIYLIWQIRKLKKSQVRKSFSQLEWDIFAFHAMTRFVTQFERVYGSGMQEAVGVDVLIRAIQVHSDYHELLSKFDVRGSVEERLRIINNIHTFYLNYPELFLEDVVIDDRLLRKYRL